MDVLLDGKIDISDALKTLSVMERKVIFMSEVKNELKNEFMSEITDLTEQINRLEAGISEQLELIEDWKDRIKRLKERRSIISDLIKTMQISEEKGS